MPELRKWFRPNLGELGERRAARYLKRQGMELVWRNWRCDRGEIDLILMDGKELVFVEVKTRVESPRVLDLIFENVTREKRARLDILAQRFLRHHLKRGFSPPSYRIDLVGVILAASVGRGVGRRSLRRRRTIEVVHLRNA